MRYPRYKPETILRLREAGALVRPNDRVRRHIYHDPVPEKESQHGFQLGVYRWMAAFTIPFAISYVTSTSPKEERTTVIEIQD